MLLRDDFLYSSTCYSIIIIFIKRLFIYIYVLVFYSYFPTIKIVFIFVEFGAFERVSRIVTIANSKLPTCFFCNHVLCMSAKLFTPHVIVLISKLNQRFIFKKLQPSLNIYIYIYYFYCNFNFCVRCNIILHIVKSTCKSESIGVRILLMWQLICKCIFLLISLHLILLTTIIIILLFYSINCQL